MFWIYVGVIFVISLLWAIVSTRKELSRPKEVKRAQKILAREKILFKR